MITCKKCGREILVFNKEDLRIEIAKRTYYHLSKDPITGSFVCICMAEIVPAHANAY